MTIRGWITSPTCSVPMTVMLATRGDETRRRLQADEARADDGDAEVTALTSLHTSTTTNEQAGTSYTVDTPSMMTQSRGNGDDNAIATLTPSHSSPCLVCGLHFSTWLTRPTLGRSPLRRPGCCGCGHAVLWQKALMCRCHPPYTMNSPPTLNTLTRWCLHSATAWRSPDVKHPRKIRRPCVWRPCSATICTA